ncbi:AraC family transcriptional regulator [Bradyrhizobium sp.]|uniref:AraC family transcriptional regulator n=1 Tax=Bradyrhizobium sp. TaxID=376 RepID=UPI0039C85941
MMPQIDLALCTGTATLLLLLAALLFRDFRGVAAGRLAIAFALGSVAHALTLGLGFAPPVALWHAALIALSSGDIVVFWLFARSLFDDEFTVRRWHALPWAAMVALSLLNCLVVAPARPWDPRIFPIVLNVISLGFVVLTVGQTVSSWSADLIEERRRLRVFVVAATAVYAGFNAVAQIFLPDPGPHSVAGILNVAILAIVVAAIVFSLTYVRGETIFAIGERPVAQAVAVGESSVADRKLVDALIRLMSYERIYRHEGITIGTLATKLAVPEYRLRRLINQQLGYRNFNVFLNDHRIEEVKAALADPSQAEVPVITIAMDAGFQSLGPFNRAFKATTGVTPSEYRRLNEARA